MIEDSDLIGLNKAIEGLTLGELDSEEKLQIKNQVFSRVLDTLVSTNAECWWCVDTIRPFALLLMECLLESNETSKLYESKLISQLSNCFKCIDCYYSSRSILYINFTKRFGMDFTKQAFSQFYTFDSNRIRNQCHEVIKDLEQQPENDQTVTKLETIMCVYQILRYPASFIHNSEIAEHLVNFIKQIDSTSISYFTNIEMLGLAPLGLYPDDAIKKWVVSILESWKPMIQQLSPTDPKKAYIFYSISNTVLYSLNLIQDTRTYSIDSLLCSNSENEPEFTEQISFQDNEHSVLLSSYSTSVEMLNFPLNMDSDSFWKYLSNLISIFPKDNFKDTTTEPLKFLLGIIYSKIQVPFCVQPQFFNCWSDTLSLLGSKYWAESSEETIFDLFEVVQKVIIWLVSDIIDKTQDSQSEVSPSPEIIAFFNFLPHLINAVQHHPKHLKVCDQVASILLYQYSRLFNHAKYHRIALGFSNFCNKLLRLLYDKNFYPQITFHDHAKLLSQMLHYRVKQEDALSKHILNQVMKHDVSQLKLALQHKPTDSTTNSINTMFWEELLAKFPSNPNSYIYVAIFENFAQILTMMDECNPKCKSFDPNYGNWIKTFYKRFLDFLSFFESHEDASYITKIVSNQKILKSFFILSISPFNEIHIKLHTILKTYFKYFPAPANIHFNYHSSVSYLVYADPQLFITTLNSMISNVTRLCAPPHKLGEMAICNIVRLMGSIIGNVNSDDKKLSEPIANIIFPTQSNADGLFANIFGMYLFILKSYPKITSINHYSGFIFNTFFSSLSVILIDWDSKLNDIQGPLNEFIKSCSIWLFPQIFTLPAQIASGGLTTANDLLEYHINHKIVPDSTFIQAIKKYIQSPPPSHPKDDELISMMQETLELITKSLPSTSANSENITKTPENNQIEVIDLVSFDDVSDGFIDSILDDEELCPSQPDSIPEVKKEIETSLESSANLKIRTLPNANTRQPLEKPKSVGDAQIEAHRMVSKPLMQSSMHNYLSPQQNSGIIVNQISSGFSKRVAPTSSSSLPKRPLVNSSKPGSLMQQLRSAHKQESAQFKLMTKLGNPKPLGTQSSLFNRNPMLPSPATRSLPSVQQQSRTRILDSPTSVSTSKVPKLETKTNSHSSEKPQSHNFISNQSGGNLFINSFGSHNPSKNIQLPKNIFSTTSSTKKPSSSLKNKSESSSDSSSEDSDKEDGNLNDLIADSKAPISNQSKSTNISGNRLYENVYNNSTSDSSSKKARSIPSRVLKYRPNYDSDVTPLDRVVLKWDYNSPRSFPVNFGQKTNLIDRTWYETIPDSFEDIKSYINVFEPLLLLEGWAQLQHSKVQSKNDEESNLILKSRNRTNEFIDMLFETSIAEGHSISENDILVVWGGGEKKEKKHQDSHHFLIKVRRTIMKKSVMEIEARACFDASIAVFSSKLFLDSKWMAKQVMAMTTFYREYLAVKNLASYPLSHDVLKRYCEPLKPLDSQEISDISNTFDVNPPQAHAIGATTLMNEGFSMIQGPPGTGKTKTILGLVGCLVKKLADQESHRPSFNTYNTQIKPKIMICAPSNAAVDEVVKRLKCGVKSRSGRVLDLKILRIGRLDAIQHNVRDVALEQLIDFSSDASNKDDPKSPKVGFNARLASFRDKIAELQDFKSKVQSEIDSVYNNLDIQAHHDSYFQNLIKRRNNFESNIKKCRFEISRIYEERAAQNNQMDSRRLELKEKLLAEADVICCTLSGAGHDALNGLINHIKVLIVDEAAQATEPSCLIPLRFNSPLCIMVGDPHQLPPTVISQEATKFKYDYSLFARVYKNHPQYAHLLSIQYRMHPAISAMPSKLFYDGKLTDGPDLNKLKVAKWHKNPLYGPYVFFDVLEGKEQQSKSFSIFNSEEACVAVWLVESLVKQNPDIDFKNRIGVVTPYKFQVRELKKKFEMRFNRQIFDSIEFATIDGFQGQEKDIIIFSAVRSSTSGIGFLSDIRRMNVGLTRAKNSLFIIANSEGLSTNKVWSSIVQDAVTRKVKVKWTPKLFEPMDMNNRLSNLVKNPPSKPSAPKSKYINPTVQKYII
jgi:predicted DNA helicase